MSPLQFVRRVLKPGRTHPSLYLRDSMRILRGGLAVHWFSENTNWGDALNPTLVRALSGRDVVQANHVLHLPHLTRYSVAGSVLHRLRGRNYVIWGSGFINGQRDSADSCIKVLPREVRAVRGPLTRGRLLEQGVDCPRTYGDPALLYRRIYDPGRMPRYRLGVVPHFIDQASPLLGRFRHEPDVLIIDILAPTNEVVDAVCSCQHIASSSLHGLILADAYGLPSTWIELSRRVKGDGFKFLDHFAAVGRPAADPVVVDEATTTTELVQRASFVALDVDLDRLLEVCPFRER